MLYLTFVLWNEREAAVFFCVEHDERMMRIPKNPENLKNLKNLTLLFKALDMTLRSYKFFEIERFIVGNAYGLPLCIV